MMDNPEYARQMVKRVRLYLSQGMIPGRNLIFTLESDELTVDLRHLELQVTAALQPTAAYFSMSPV